MLLALGLPSFDTVIHNYRNPFLCVWSNRSNDMVKLLRCVCPSAFLWVLLCSIVHLVLFFFFFSFTYTVYKLSVCMSPVYVYGPCCLILNKMMMTIISFCRKARVCEINGQTDRQRKSRQKELASNIVRWALKIERFLSYKINVKHRMNWTVWRTRMTGQTIKPNGRRVQRETTVKSTCCWYYQWMNQSIMFTRSRIITVYDG